jgi:hypothetical protein
LVTTCAKGGDGDGQLKIPAGGSKNLNGGKVASKETATRTTEAI